MFMFFLKFCTICYWNHLDLCLSVLLLVCVNRFSSSETSTFTSFLCIPEVSVWMDSKPMAHLFSTSVYILPTPALCWCHLWLQWCGLFISLYPKQLFLGHLLEPQQHNPYMGGPWNPLVLPRVFMGICFRRRPWDPGGLSYFFILPLHPHPPAFPCLVVRGATLEV